MKTRINSLLAVALSLVFANSAWAGWVEFEKLVASDDPYNGRFGGSVSIDGEYCIIGASSDDSNGSSAGSAYLFRYKDGSWVEETKLTASDGDEMDFFGSCVSVSGDYCIVAAYADEDNGYNSGSAYVFKRDGTDWVEQAKLMASDGFEYQYFGRSVAISGDYCVVGANGDGDKGFFAGAAYIFKREGTDWVEEAKLTASDGSRKDYFGWVVSICGDYCVVGALLDDDHGDKSGSAYIFKREGTSWTEEAKLIAPDGAAQDHFGGAVSICGEYVMVGVHGPYNNANYKGSAYIFKRDGTGWVQQAKVMASDAVGGEWFGGSVSIGGDYCIVGANFDDENGFSSGSAYIFKWESESWIEQAKLTASDGETFDWFGRSVCVGGGTCVIGAYGDDSNGTFAGSAYVFELQKPLVEAEIDIGPKTLNLSGKGKWITCQIWLPEGYDVADVNSYSVFLEDEIGAEWIWVDEEEQIVMTKFSRSEVQEMLEPGEVELTVSGELTDGTRFEGTDTIKVIDKGRTENHKPKP